MSVIHNQEEQESKCRRNTERDEDDDEDKDKNISINIYRFKFTQEFMDEIHKFAKVHQYDDRHIFKEAWTIWLEVNNELVEGEMKMRPILTTRCSKVRVIISKRRVL